MGDGDNLNKTHNWDEDLSPPPSPVVAKAPADPLIDRSFGQYRILSRLGAGGMGVVYQAKDTRLDRLVAVKVLASHYANQPEILRRFEIEAKAAASLNHPNIVTIFEFATEGENHLLVMEYLPKGTVHDLVRQTGPLSWRQACEIVADVCKGLRAAHEIKLIHRDIKPSNILLTKEGTAKLADFGLVKLLEGKSSHLSLPGKAVGTPAFMSPEQCRNETLDPRTDLYSLGVTLYFLLTGQAPYSGTEPLQVMFSHCSSPIPDLSKKGIPAECTDIVKRAMAKKRSDRFSSADEILKAFEQILHRTPTLPSTLPPEPFKLDSDKSEINLGSTVVVPLSASPDKPSRRKYLIGLGTALAGLTGIGGYFVFGNRRDKPSTNSNKITPIENAPLRKITLQPRKNLVGHRGEVRTIRFPNDSEFVLTSGGDQTARLWTVKTGSQVQEFRSPSKTLYSATFLDRQTILTGDEEHVRFWNIAEGKVIATNQDRQTFFDVMLSADGQRVCTASGYAGAKVWKRVGKTGLEEIANIPSGVELAITLIQSPEPHVVGVVFFDSVFLLLDLETQKVLHRTPKIPVRSAVYSHYLKQYLLGMSSGIMSWTPGETPITFPSALNEKNDTVRGLTFSPDGQTLVYPKDSKQGLHLLHVPSNTEMVVKYPSLLRSVVFSPDGKVVITGSSQDGLLQIWDVVEIM